MNIKIMSLESAGLKKLIMAATILVGLIFIGFSYSLFSNVIDAGKFLASPSGNGSKHSPESPEKPIMYGESAAVTLYETEKDKDSKNPYVWVNSGGLLFVEDNIGKTVSGELPPDSFWRIIYSLHNPIDTDNGFHPQNIFRLITRYDIKNSDQEAYFKINTYRNSQSPNRNESNGIFFLSRYDRSGNTYYSGIRVDGAAVIKKKQGGSYTTLVYTPLFPGNYDRRDNPNLLPTSKWIGLKLTTVGDKKSGVSLVLYADMAGNGNWIEAVRFTDYGMNYSPIIDSGRGGIRSDFMDLEIKGYKIQEINQ